MLIPVRAGVRRRTTFGRPGRTVAGRAADDHSREGGSMGIKAVCRRSLVVTAVLGATCAVALGAAASPALAQTAQQKQAAFQSCIGSTKFSSATFSFFIDCCHIAGGTVVNVTYDSHGNPTGMGCMLVADPAQTQQGPGLSNAVNLPTSLNTNGITTSGGSSGGISHAGLYGLFQIVVTSTTCPPDSITTC